MQGLYDKASRVPDILPGKLASLQAIINKMPTRYRSEAPKTTAPIFQKDEEAGELIRQILAKFPEHKRVLFLQSKYENHEKLSPADIADLKRFAEVVRKSR